MIIQFDPRHDRMTERRVTALGFFDGVHLAHRHLLALARERARAIDARFCVLTFPSEDGPKGGAAHIYPTEEKCALLEAVGADEVLLIDFSAVSDMGAEPFVRDVLVDRLHTVLAVCGYNFRFGKGALGDAEALTRLMRSTGGDAVVDERFLFRGEPLSASWIRDRLREGDVNAANPALLTPYHLCGKVEHGHGRGRAFGFPTLNLPIPTDCLAPRFGVYRSAVRIGDRITPAITNVGTCPTFGARLPHAETYLIDATADLYGETVTVYLLDFLREERTFVDSTSLQEQIRADVARAKHDHTEDLWLKTGQN